MTPLAQLCADRGWTIETTRDRIYVALLEEVASLVEGEPAMFVGCSIRDGVVRPHIETTTDEHCAEAVAAWPSLQAMARELREVLQGLHDRLTAEVARRDKGGRTMSDYACALIMSNGRCDDFESYLGMDSPEQAAKQFIAESEAGLFGDDEYLVAVVTGEGVATVVNVRVTVTLKGSPSTDVGVEDGDVKRGWLAAYGMDGVSGMTEADVDRRIKQITAEAGR